MGSWKIIVFFCLFVILGKPVIRKSRVHYFTTLCARKTQGKGSRIHPEGGKIFLAALNWRNSLMMALRFLESFSVQEFTPQISTSHLSAEERHTYHPLDLRTSMNVLALPRREKKGLKTRMLQAKRQ
ncbi:hypothetical protein BKA82DRAFT_390161 [Pisolithus tinctorius]|uniref:Secreted protein n=1 Tax=Pisolithus tinctorius Marx 270 TaxID=870435 RepID=A0A0C3PHV0_PISTI|nr:hypothetical protein BKA82DRAFT_390161 [Pisolithus tinctorius]KIO07614.1 hypothetical protein M404DRAFT_390161 [Pisolithus tinctorius Marx 270]